MPTGLRKQEINIGQAYRAEQRKGGILTNKELERLVDRYDGEFVGEGEEAIVIGREGRPEKVVAISYAALPPAEAKRTFYPHRIASTLFPYNFPHFYASIGGSTTRSTTGTVRQRIRGRIRRPRKENKHPFKKILGIRETLDLPVSIDTYAGNFIRTDDGGEYYLDKLRLKQRTPWNLPAIRKYMDEAKTGDEKPAYTDRNKRIVEKSIRRLAALGLTQVIE